MMDNKRLFMFLLIFLVIIQYKFVYLQGRGRVVSLNKVIEEKRSDLESLQKLCAEYKEKQKNEEENAVKVSGEDFSLFSYVGGLLTKRKLEKNITGIQPLPLSEKGSFKMERLSLSIKDVTLKQLYDFLYEIENSKNAVYTSYFVMRKNKEQPFFLNVEMELVALKSLAP